MVKFCELHKSKNNSRKLRSIHGCISTALIAALLSPAVSAELMLEEVVVTAQKRSESLQDVPIAVSALNQEALKERGFQTVADLSYMVPSLQFGNFGPTVFLNIRGIGSENTTGGSDPGVALHLDGVYVGRPVGAIFSSFDTERVEVLRGPQGTLYGRNATGGSINVITSKPDEELGGAAEVTVGDYDLLRIRGAVNLPISDSISARLVGFTEDRDGYTKNSVAGGTEANDKDDYGVRGHINFELSKSASLLLSATYISSEGVGAQPEQRDVFSTGVLFGPGPDFLKVIADENGPLTNDLRPFREGKNTAESQDNEFTLVSATLDWDFESFSIKSITGYVDSAYESIQDSDSSPAIQAVLTVQEESEQYSQEIQFLSGDESSFTWIAGLYYFKEEVDRFTSLTGARYDAVQGFLTAMTPNFNEAYAFRIGGDIETTSYAAFAQGTYDFSDALSLTLGLRYTDDEKEGFNRNIQFAPMVIDSVGTDSQEETGKITLDWKFDESSMLYSSFARGYKSGGVSQTTIEAGGANAEFEPEYVDTFEIGLKSRLWDDRVQLNIAVYNNDYTDLQFQVFGDFGPEAGNAGEATISGLEIELMALLTETWQIDGNIAYTDAEYDELKTGPGEDFDFSGNKLPRIPEIAYNVGISGNWGFDNGSSLRARLEGSYTDEIYYEFRNGPEALADDYYNANFRLFWTSPNSKFTVEAFVNNLTDEEQEGNILVGFSLGAEPGETGIEYVSYNAPRNYGVTLGYLF